MFVAPLNQVQYKYHSPLPFTGKKQEKFSIAESYPDIHAFNQAKRTYNPKQGTIACAPDEVQKFYEEIGPELDKFKTSYGIIQKNGEAAFSRIVSDIANMQNITNARNIKSNAKIVRNEGGYSYKEYDGRFVTKEITKTPKKLRIEKAEGNNKKTITICDIEVNKQTGKSEIVKIKHTMGYHKTGLGAESYDREYVFEDGNLKSYAQNFSSDGKGNGKSQISATFGSDKNHYFENSKHVAGEASFVDKAIFFDKKGQVNCYMKNPINSTNNIVNYDQKMEFDGGQPVLYIRDGISKGKNYEETFERYAKFTGTGWTFTY